MRKRKEWERGFYDGALCALRVAYDFEGGCNTLYTETVRAIGARELVTAARRNGEMKASGLSQFIRENPSDIPQDQETPGHA